ncbi:MAG: hypothetical protein ACK4P4_02805 [Allorhizobium sp.]
MSLGPGARRLNVCRDQKIVVACDRCGLSRRYDGNAMIDKLGPDVALPDLIGKIARAEGCELVNAPTPNGLRCGLKFHW